MSFFAIAFFRRLVLDIVVADNKGYLWVSGILRYTLMRFMYVFLLDMSHLFVLNRVCSLQIMSLSLFNYAPALCRSGL